MCRSRWLCRLIAFMHGTADARGGITTSAGGSCHSLIDRIAIIRTVRDEAGNLAIDLLKQPGNFPGVIGTIVGEGIRDDFASACVNRQVQLPPGPATTTVSFLIPFALSEQFQPGAVDDQMSGSVRDHTRPPISKNSRYVG
jgi:hypothetical protein